MRRSTVVALEQFYLARQRQINFHGRHRFVDRSAGHETVVVVLTGYKPHLWDLTLPRLRRHLPGDVDVCLVCPGVDVPEMEAEAAAAGWSYLSTRPNYPSLAINLAIERHPRARSILKLDEDMFIGAAFVPRMLAAYERVAAGGAYRPGFVAPTINVNGFGYVHFLETMGLLDAYRERFGPTTRAAGGIPVTDDGLAARWIWERSVPFDEVSERFAALAPGYRTVPHKFSIGAILFRREFWDFFGGFKVRPFVGGIGVDEQYLCVSCITFSRVMAVADDVLAGHFSFSDQDEVMRAALPGLRDALVAGASG